MQISIASRPSIQRHIGRRGTAKTSLWFVIMTPRHIRSDVAVLREDIHYLIGHSFIGRHAPPVISLFRYEGYHANDLLNFVKNRMEGCEPFNVFIKNLGYCPNGNGRMLFLDIVNRFSIMELTEQLIGETHHIFPHIPLATNLPEDDFLKCWNELKDLPYSQHFPCIEITVLVREGRIWQKHCAFTLEKE
jgi:hypothetical protein